MYTIKVINYFSEDYKKTLDLRNEVMRKPLGLNIYDQDFSHEEHSLILGAFQGEELHGVGVLAQDGDISKVEYLCVDTRLQKGGVGSMLLKKLEEIAAERNAVKICMDARVSAAEFYKKHGYEEVGEIFLMEVAPVDHILMEKKVESL